MPLKNSGKISTIKEYLEKDAPDHQPLFAEVRGEICRLGISSITGGVVVQDGVNRFPIQGQDFVLTPESEELLTEFRHQRELTKSAIARAPEVNLYTTLVSNLFQDETPETKGIMRFPEVKWAMKEFEKAMEGHQETKCGLSNRNESYLILYKCKKAAQALLKIVRFLSRKKEFKTYEDLCDIKSPNIALYDNNEREVRELVLKITEIIGCKEPVADHLRRRKTVRIKLILFDHNSTRGSFECIDSATVTII